MTGDDRAPLPTAMPPDSRLRSVFLQHRLHAALPPLRGVPPAVAKFALGAIVDRLLRVPGGLEPLIALERDAGRLAAGAALGVLTVMLGHAAGWPAHAVPDLGAAAMLGELGADFDRDDPSGAGCRWFLRQGTDDFWLRCALVARHGFSADGEVLPPGAGVVVLVRLAVRVRAAMQGAAGEAWWEPAAAAKDALPPELVALVPTVFASG